MHWPLRPESHFMHNTGTQAHMVQGRGACASHYKQYTMLCFAWWHACLQIICRLHMTNIRDCQPDSWHERRAVATVVGTHVFGRVCLVELAVQAVDHAVSKVLTADTRL
jgi:hypothetical protein